MYICKILKFIYTYIHQQLQEQNQNTKKQTINPSKPPRKTKWKSLRNQLIKLSLNKYLIFKTFNT